MALRQCTEAMKNLHKGEETYDDLDGYYDFISLLLLRNSISYYYESKSYPILVIYMVLRKFYSCYQSITLSCDEYFETMTNLRDVISHCGGVIVNHTFLVEKILKAIDPGDPGNPTNNETAAAKTTTEEAYMATAFLSGLNRSRYGVILNELHNAFHMGREEYPNMLTAANDLAINWNGGTKETAVTLNDVVAFTTESEEADVHATDGMNMTL